MRATAPFRKPLDTSLFQVLLTTVPCLLLFGSVWHSAEAGMLGISLNTTGTLYDIDEGDGTASNPRIVGDKIDMIAMSTSGVLYGVSQGFTTDVPPGGMLYTIDVGTGSPTLVGTLTELIVVEGDIAFDPTSGMLYGVDSEGSLFTIDTGTAVCSVIGDVGDGLDLSAMAFDSSGDLWMVDSFGPRLIQIDKFTAAILDSKPLGPINQEIGGLAFRPSDGTLFHAAGLASMLYTIDTGTGTPSVIGPISVPGGIWGLTFTQDPVPTIDTTWGKVKASFRRP